MTDEKQYVSRVRLVDGTIVNIKDQEARTNIKELSDGQVAVNKDDIAALFEQIQWGEF